jgi:hypothetical protein
MPTSCGRVIMNLLGNAFKFVAAASAARWATGRGDHHRRGRPDRRQAWLRQAIRRFRQGGGIINRSPAPASAWRS